MYIDVTPLQRTPRDSYTYRSDVELPIGSVVRIRLGGASVLGVVNGPGEPHPKAVVATSTGVHLSEVQYQLARWMAEEYLAHPGMALRQTIWPAILKSPQSVERLTNTPRDSTSVLHGGVDRYDRYELAISSTLRDGKSVLLIVPEASHIRTLCARYKTYLPASYHARQRAITRAETWWLVATGAPMLYIATRGGLHLPWQQLGLVIVDDEDDMAYKQDQAPRYHARPAAAKLAALSGAQLLFGSLGPSLEAFSTAVYDPGHRAEAIVRLTPPEYEGVSFAAWEGLRAAHSAFVYTPLRRRSEVTALLTKEFGSAVGTGKSARIRVGGAGDVTLSRNRDVAVVLGVDTILELPDFRASEKALSLLRKVTGLLSESGTLVVETAQPRHKIFSSVTGDWETWANEELSERRLLRLPPANRLSRIVVSDPREMVARETVEAVGRELAVYAPDVGPCPIPFDKGNYRFQVVIKGDPKRLRGHLHPEWKVDVDPLNLL